MRVTLGGAEVDLVERDELLARVRDRLNGSAAPPLCITTADLDHIYHFGMDSGRQGEFDRRRGSVEWVVIPGGGWVSRRARQSGGHPCEPADLEEVLRTVAAAGATVGLVTDSAQDRHRLLTEVTQQHPTLEIAAAWVLDERAPLRPSGVDVLLVDLGKPRQEAWLREHGAASGARLAVAVGRDPSPSPLRRLAVMVRLLAGARPSFGGSYVDELAHRTPNLSSPARWRARVGRGLVAADALTIAVASLLAYLSRAALGELGVVGSLENEVPAAIGVLPLWLAILWGLGCYQPQYLNSGGEALRRFFAGAFAGLLALGFASFALDLQLSRGYVVLLFVLVLVLGSSSRLAVRAYLHHHRRRGRYLQNTLIVGADEEAVQVAQAMAARGSGYRVVGFVDDDLPVGAAVTDGLQVIGRSDQVLDLAYQLRAGLVVVSPTGVRAGTLRELTIALEGSPIDVAVAPSLFQVVTRRVTVESVNNLPLLHVDQIRLRGARAVLKRSLDVAGSALLLVLLSPLMAVAALAVKVGDRGPVLFRQVRVGRDGVPFTMLKFRTMVVDAEGRLPEVASLNEAGHRFFKVRVDPRVTEVGRWLRKWSVDESPQLWNVLRGEMSLVGPRPPLPGEVEKYESWHLRRLRVRPGITGVWQVSGRSDIPFDEAVRLDLFYIENWSLGYDLFLLAKTVRAVLGRVGAY